MANYQQLMQADWITKGSKVGSAARAPVCFVADSTGTRR